MHLLVAEHKADMLAETVQKLCSKASDLAGLAGLEVVPAHSAAIATALARSELAIVGALVAYDLGATAAGLDVALAIREHRGNVPIAIWGGLDPSRLRVEVAAAAGRHLPLVPRGEMANLSAFVQAVLEPISWRNPTSDARRAAARFGLTRSEQELLQGWLEGKSDLTIRLARRGGAKKTYEAHSRSVLRKLGVTTAREAIVLVSAPYGPHVIPTRVGRRASAHGDGRLSRLSRAPRPPLSNART